MVIYLTKTVASTVSLIVLAMLCACTYGPQQTAAYIADIAARPGSHELAFAVNFERSRPATGINAFPNGGIPKRIEREARIYLCRVDEHVIEQLAAVPDYDGIPSAASVWIIGWVDQYLYFRLHGYERDAAGGSDQRRPIEIVYRVERNGTPIRVDQRPAALSSQPNSGPTGSEPFLRYSRGSNDIDIAINKRLSAGGPDARVLLPIDGSSPLLETFH